MIDSIKEQNVGYNFRAINIITTHVFSIYKFHLRLPLLKDKPYLTWAFTFIINS